jgi:hypothetical protein
MIAGGPERMPLWAGGPAGPERLALTPMSCPCQDRPAIGVGKPQIPCTAPTGRVSCRLIDGHPRQQRLPKWEGGGGDA